jgi:hypothetical protein
MATLTDKYTDATYQEQVRQFVGREVYYCVSSLISHLAKDTESEYYDDILSICVKDDYEQACLDEGWEFNDTAYGVVMHKDCELWDTGSESITEFDSWDEALEAIANDDDFIIDDEADMDWRSLAEALSVDPHQIEAYEHWIVSEYLARKLEAKGQMVSTDIHGLVVWGRPTTGQAILIDHVICEIYDEMMAV